MHADMQKAQKNGKVRMGGEGPHQQLSARPVKQPGQERVGSPGWVVSGPDIKSGEPRTTPTRARREDSAGLWPRRNLAMNGPRATVYLCF